MNELNQYKTISTDCWRSGVRNYTFKSNKLKLKVLVILEGSVMLSSRIQSSILFQSEHKTTEFRTVSCPNRAILMTWKRIPWRSRNIFMKDSSRAAVDPEKQKTWALLSHTADLYPVLLAQFRYGFCCRQDPITNWDLLKRRLIMIWLF